jgi:transposase
MFVGIDLHKLTLNAAVMDEEGKVLNEVKIKSEPDSLKNFSESLPAKSDVVIESSSTCYWAYRVLSERHNVVLSNPMKTKAIASAKVKTDKIDALTLANLLRGGYIAQSYIPPAEVMQLRELVRYRANLVRIRAIIKNKVHAKLFMYNVKIDGYPFTQEYMNKL